MQPIQTEENDVRIPLIAFNISLIALVISLGFLIYRVDTKKDEVVQENTHTAVFIKPEVIATSYIVLDIQSDTVIAAKNAEIARPLASVTKVMSAVVARSVLPKDSPVTIRREFLEEEGDSGLRDGEVFKLSDLLDLSLIISSNDGARSIASVAGAFMRGTSDYTFGRSEFIKEMNTQSKKLGLNSFSFNNETGLDNTDGTSGGYGNAHDVAKLFAYALKEYPDLLEMTSHSKDTVKSVQYIHDLENTNSSLGEIPNIIASKTGFTAIAGGNLAIVFDAGFGKPIAIVVLGSTTDGRFTDMVALASSTLQYIKQ
jgi:D-alanyl-D-alanine carboxypeptidase